MKIVGSIQARMSSSRLPGKVLREVCGKPMLLWQVERLRLSRLLDEVIVATTENRKDDEIVNFCAENKIKYFRGSEEDVLGRIAALIRKNSIELHVEFCGDSPLIDPHIVDETIGYYLKNKGKYDLVSNALITTYPPGQEVTVYKNSALLKVDRLLPRNDKMREHCSLNISLHKEIFSVCNLSAPRHYYHPDIYLEVDTGEDLVLIRKIIEHFYKNGNAYFSLAQILDFLMLNRKLAESNRRVFRRWKKYRTGNDFNV